MKEVAGLLDHRILINFRVDPEIMRKNIPPYFTPKIVSGYAIGGICQVSLSEIRPKGLPAIVGTKSHNAAHRVAVSSPAGEGVYVIRRDTSSPLNALLGGRFFPGVHGKADFNISSNNDIYNVIINSNDGKPFIKISGIISDSLPAGSVFKSTDDASEFFRGGNIGWSLNLNGDGYETVELKTMEWKIQPLETSEVYSDYFMNNQSFPAGSVEFDSAMIMRGLEHSWLRHENICGVCT
jgi:hypothetical protein